MSAAGAAQTGRAGDAAGGADLRHVTTWLFDLDNTLYPLESGLAGLTSARITDYVERLTGLPRAQAHDLQKRYLVEHGLTLRGLMTHYDVDPDHYHAQVGDVDLACLAPDEALAAALRRLPGRRIIFTNADAGHVERVLARLQLADLFEAVFHIESAGYHPKPTEESFERMAAAHHIEPASTAFFEDSERNLEPAARMGMTTVLIGAHAQACAAPFVHHRAAALAPFLAAAKVKDTP